MTTTRMPGFTAESSLYTTGKHYMAGVFDPQAAACVQPAVRNTCEVLSGLLWDAYLGGSYTAAQFFYDAMEAAGCFRSAI
jgi:hypothetical protein